MIGDAEELEDQGADAIQRPALGLVPGGDRPLAERLEGAPPLLGRQAGRPPGLGPPPQRRRPALPQGPGPVADGHAGDAQPAGDLGLGQLASPEEPAALQAAFFHLVGGEFARLPHTRIVRQLP
jgi:hypothetical protein